MKRTMISFVICALTGVPAMAQEAAGDAPRLTLRGIPLNRALTTSAMALEQDPAAQANPLSTSAEREGKPLYVISLAAAVAGVAYNIHTTREALDRHLGARTFPFVWKTTTDPADKGKLTGIIAGVNGGLMAVSGVVFYNRHPGLATAINVMVAAATTGVALRNRSIINDDKAKRP